MEENCSQGEVRIKASRGGSGEEKEEGGEQGCTRSDEQGSEIIRGCGINNQERGWLCTGESDQEKSGKGALCGKKGDGSWRCVGWDFP